MFEVEILAELFLEIFYIGGRMPRDKSLLEKE